MSRKSDKRFIRILIDDFTKYLDNLKNEYANMEDGETSHSDSDSPSEGNDDTVVSSKVAEDVGNICNSLKSHIGVIQTNVNTSYRHFKAKKEITSKRAIEADNSNQIKNSESQPVNSSLVNNALNNNHDDNNLAKENNSRDSTTPTISEKSSVNENDNCNTNTNKFSLKIIQIEKLLKPGITNTNVPNAIANHAPVTINLDSDSDSNSNFQDAVAKLESDDDADDDDDAIVAWKKNKPTAKKISRVIDSDSDDDVPLIKTATQAKKLKTISPTKSIDAGTESDNSNSAKVSTTKKSKKDKKDKKSKTNVLKRVEKNCVVTIEQFPNTLEALLDKFNLDSVDDVNNENISPENYKKIFLNRDQETLLNHRRKIIGDEKPKAMKRKKSHKKKKSTKKELKTKNNRKKMSENNNRYDSDEDDESSKQTYSTEKEEDNDIRCLKTSSSSDNSSSSSSSSSSSGSGSSSSSGSGGSSSSSSSSDDSDDNEEKTEKQVSASKKRKYLNGEGSVVAAAVRAITANNDDEDDEAETAQEDANENNAESDNEEEDDEDENVVNVKQEEELDLDDNAEEREDEEDEELFQPKKKKIKTDASVKEDQQTNEKKGRKRRRIKKVSSSEDENDDKNSPNKGRKNIRKLLTKDSLDATTKQAAREERERKMRIEERQKMYNQIYDGKPEEIKELNKLVLDFDEETKEVLLEADKKLVKKLKPHQATGIKFMFDACFESMERMHNSEGSGCILAHCMGLGKTLQVITLCHTLLSNSDRTNVNRILVVCPLSTVLNWVNEFKIWLKHVDKNDDLEIYEISKYKQNIDRANKLMEWHNDGGVMILGYEMFRNLTNDTGTKLKKKIKQSLQTSLVDPGPDLIVCDEGHLLKNEKTSLSKAMNRIRTQRRIVLTGTPLQNNLKEYYCMVTFVKPNLLGKYNEYMNRFVNPITNGQYTDSTERDIQIMKRRSHVLHKMLDGCVQRKDYSVLAPFLPPKHEYVVSVRLTKMQIELYEYYMQNKSMLVEQQNQKRSSILFTDFQNLQRIWTHPRVLRYNSDKYEQVQAKKREMESEEESEGSLKNFIDDDDEDEEEASSSSDSDSVQSVNSDDSYNPKKKKNVRPPRRTRATYKVEDDPVEVKKKEDNPTEWWMQICPEDQLDNIEHSGKLKILFSILEECEAIGDKLLVFSQSLYSLDVIEHFLALSDNKGSQSWSLGLDYFRLDGSTSVENRSLACNIFNQVDNPRARLFLISTRAGGLGINLTAANRVIIFDVSWNPSHDIQSIFRVYRFGQDKPCYVYRFLAMGTMEEKIYERQVTKQAISKRVIDEQQIDRHYKENDLQELYRYELVPTEPRSIPSLPKDRLFAELFKKYEDIIFKFHEHDSLLENKEEETLNEEERKAAWDEFEAEKNRPVQTYNFIRGPGTGPVTSNNIYGLRSDILLRLLSLKARHDHPQFDDLQIKSMIPILMQELHSQMAQGEITLYQSLLTFLSELEVPQYGYNPMLNNMIGNYNNMIAAANAASGSHSHTSNNIAPLSTTMTPTQLNIMRLINQQKMMEQEQQHASLMNAMPQQQSGGIEQHNHMIEQAQNRLMNLKKTNIPPSATIEID